MVIEKRILGQTGIEVSRIGISSSFGADVSVFNEALEAGCNYFTWGTFIRGRSRAFKDFMQDIAVSGRREQVVLGLLSYSHTVTLGERFLQSALRQLRTDYIDCLVLGYFSSRPPQRLLNWAQHLKERGVIRAVGLTTHNRDIVAQLSREQIVDFFHFRYNAVHRGAEDDIFPLLGENRPGLVSFTATSWGQLLQQKKMAPTMMAASAGDCYRFVLERDEIDICMMGVRDIKMFRENMEIIKKGRMTDEEVSVMREIGDHLYGKPRKT